MSIDSLTWEKNIHLCFKKENVRKQYKYKPIWKEYILKCMVQRNLKLLSSTHALISLIHAEKQGSLREIF